ncbi:MAG: hypothetical protein IT372_30485 [Polyangiaceae bacterium]|nr:hypothetical protein [Polyangiaceae bacterium]
MTSKTVLTLAMAALLSLGAGCKKEEQTTTNDSAPAPPGADTPAAAVPGDVGTCPGTMVPQGGTKRILQNFTVYQSPDPASKKLTGLATGTLINLKGSCGNWMLIEWPSGVGQLSPGWIELRLNDSRAAEDTKASTTATPTATATAAPTASATAAPTATASATAAPGKPIIKPPRR